MMSKHLYGAALMGAIVTMVGIQGCSSDASNPLCCNEFKIGATVDPNIGGSVTSKVAVQAVADFAGIASSAIDDLTTACQNIATDLGQPEADLETASAITDSQQRMNTMCGYAEAQIKTILSAGVTLTVNATAPQCDVSVSAKASCQASCQVNPPVCDFKAHPPTCTGGTLEVSCDASCDPPSVGVQIDCTGTCSGSCTGSCTVDGNVGVQCAGQCNGTCSADASGGSGTGIQADGTCHGLCKGTCAVTYPKASCTGSCQGKCDASCKGSATAKVQCSGTCSGNIQPLTCKGGTLSGGCTPPDAKCDANCDASVRAKAECTPPAVSISFTSNTGDPNILAALKATLETNLGVVFAFKSRLAAMADISTTFIGNVGAVVDIKAACIPPVIAAVGQAGSDLTASVSATGSLLASVGSGS